jgi:hypothetical protein
MSSITYQIPLKNDCPIYSSEEEIEEQEEVSVAADEVPKPPVGDEEEEEEGGEAPAPKRFKHIRGRTTQLASSVNNS